ncbi:hypothetical protein RchiOBHm_Chr3g0492401 [Rosa chinensis]|uniref:Uncharacterized protein n=1 Tax=Rosa chinensis TaxID=74649 RepID=A0A2P6RGH1_ROSCH|nr:hypothetical protein RchiOBHm_Chr3g0492401 [Rosa chinensis]
MYSLGALQKSCRHLFLVSDSMKSLVAQEVLLLLSQVVVLSYLSFPLSLLICKFEMERFLDVTQKKRNILARLGGVLKSERLCVDTSDRSSSQLNTTHSSAFFN